jgi:hypothetical protein
MNDSLLSRLGTFFILLSLGLVILFFGSHFNLLYLILAVAALLLGISMHRKVPRPEASRFSSLRRLRQRSTRSIEQEDQNSIKDQKQ